MAQPDAESWSFLSVKTLLIGISALWLSIPIAVQTLVVMMGIDYLTGMLVALYRREWSYSEGWRGLLKKTLVLLLVIAAGRIARPLNLGFDVGAAVAMGYACNELISIAKNATRADVPIPGPLRELLSRAEKIAGGRRESKRDK